MSNDSLTTIISGARLAKPGRCRHIGKSSQLQSEVCGMCSTGQICPGSPTLYQLSQVTDLSVHTNTLINLHTKPHEATQ